MCSCHLRLSVTIRNIQAQQSDWSLLFRGKHGVLGFHCFVTILRSSCAATITMICESICCYRSHCYLQHRVS